MSHLEHRIIDHIIHKLFTYWITFQANMKLFVLFRKIRVQCVAS